ncbi:MAG: glycosyltransferase family 4 protein [Chloroflexi bacterium]|nr:glycosyltransferase family 4 protein [Chloroflexota bacterium]
MKIALVSPYDYPYPGGVTEHIAHLDQHLTRLGHEVRIIAPSSQDAEVLEAERVYKVGRVVPIPSNGSVARITLSIHLAWRLRSFLEREHFDVIHLHEPLVPSLPLTVLFLSHSLNIGTFHQFGRTNIHYFYGRPVLRRFMGKLDGRIAVSASALRFVSRRFPGQYAIIPNGIEWAEFGPDELPFPELLDGKKNILFVGRMEKRKGFKYLLKAFPIVKAHIPEARLIVVGAYSEKAQRRYEHYTQEHGLQDVLFTGQVSSEDLRRYYRSCDVFCAPSTGGESFGIVLLEAMASGKPFVASDIEGYRQLVEDGREGLLVPPKNEYALAEALLRLLNDPAQCRAMGEEGRRRSQAYDWSSVTQQVLDYYSEAQEEKARRLAGEVRRPRRWMVPFRAIGRASRAFPRLARATLARM